MDANLIAIIGLIIATIIGFLAVTIAILQGNNNLRIEFSNRFDKLEAQNKENFNVLSARIDAVNSRLDSLYNSLFKKDAA